MKRNTVLRSVLVFLVLLLASGLTLAQGDTQTFEMPSDFPSNRISFSYSSQIAGSATWKWMPATHDMEVPTGPVPEYTRIDFQNWNGGTSQWENTGQYILVYPVVTFPTDPTTPFARELANLRDVLAARPNLPDGELPMLPIVTNAQYFRAQVQYLDFPSGSGIRYVTAAGLDVSPLSESDLFYSFQGLTSDGEYYIAARFPVTSGVIPDISQNMNSDQYSQFAANWDSYLAGIVQGLNALAPSGFSPDLSIIDSIFTSLKVNSPVATIVTPPDAQTVTAAYDNVSFSYDAPLASRVEVDVIQPVVDTGGMTMFGSQPGYTAFSLFGYPVTGTTGQPVIRVLPVSSFPGSDSISDQILANLKDFMAARPALTAHTNSSNPNPIPVLPAINAAQVFVAKPAYIDFQNGSGARFITYYAQDVSPITNDRLLYVFTGMTADGQYAISAQFPVNASVLPEVDLNTLDYNAFAANYLTYLQTTLATLDGADSGSYSPVLDELDNLIRSLRVG